MKLDRNTNRGGRGKYALVSMRKMIPLLDRGEDHLVEDVEAVRDQMSIHAFNHLLQRGIITLGNETPGDQFFVMKYKDRFTASGLHAYAVAVAGEANALRQHNAINPQSDSLDEYAAQMFLEAKNAKELGIRIPD